MLGALWPAALAMIATWIVIALLTRYSSLSALTAALLGPFYAIAFGNLSYALLALALTVIIFLTHRHNIRRLLRGREPHIGEK